MKLLVYTITLLVGCASNFNSFAAEVWDGPMIIISRQSGQEVEDDISPTVSLTRGEDSGLYNSTSESAFSANISPRGTAWAFAGLNGNPNDTSFAASNYQNLTFDTWLQSLGGQGMVGNNIVGTPAVLHLVDDDVYLDILFSEWGSAGEGAIYSYTRSSPSGTGTQIVAQVPIAREMLALLFFAVAGISTLFYRRVKPKPCS